MKQIPFYLMFLFSINIGAQDIQSPQSGNVLDALSGLLAGVNVINYSGDPTSKGPTVMINGVRSLCGSNPLLVVDGIIYEGDVSSINPNDVEYVRVVSSGAGLVKYGKRAQDGVLEITTKKGDLNYLSYNKSGLGGTKELLNFRGKWGVNSNAIGQYDLMNREEEDAFYRMRGFDNLNIPANAKFIDYYDELYTTGLRQEYNVDYSKKLDKGSVFASMSYLDNGGIFRGNSSKRITARVNAVYEPKAGMKFGVNSSFAHIDRKKSFDDDDLLKIQANSRLLYEEDKYHFYDYRYEGYDNERTNTFSLNTYADIHFNEELSLNASFSYMTDSPSRDLNMLQGSKDWIEHIDRGDMWEGVDYELYSSNVLSQSYRTYSLSPEVKMNWIKEMGMSRLSLCGGTRFNRNGRTSLTNDAAYSYWYIESSSNMSNNFPTLTSKNVTVVDAYFDYNSLFASANYNFDDIFIFDASINEQSHGLESFCYCNTSGFLNWSLGAQRIFLVEYAKGH